MAEFPVDACASEPHVPVITLTITGPAGSGKTTLLNLVGAELLIRGYDVRTVDDGDLTPVALTDATAAFTSDGRPVLVRTTEAGAMPSLLAAARSALPLLEAYAISATELAACEALRRAIQATNLPPAQTALAPALAHALPLIAGVAGSEADWACHDTLKAVAEGLAPVGEGR